MMKFVYLSILAATVATMSRPAAAGPYLDHVGTQPARSNTVNNVFTVEPINLLLGQLTFGQERRLGSYVSLVAKTSLHVPAVAIEDLRGFERSPAVGIGGELGLRLWANGQALRGFFVEPFVEATYLSFDTSRRGSRGAKEAGIFGAGGRLGWQWLVGPRTAVTLAGGAGYRHTSTTISGGIFDEQARGHGGAAPAVTFATGLAF